MPSPRRRSTNRRSENPTLTSSFSPAAAAGGPRGGHLAPDQLSAFPSGALLEFRGAMVCPYPLFHMGAWTIALQQWQARDAVVLVPSAHAASICRAVTTHRATRLNCIPALWRRILDHLASRTAAPRRSARCVTRYRNLGHPQRVAALYRAGGPAAEVRVFYGSTKARKRRFPRLVRFRDQRGPLRCTGSRHLGAGGRRRGVVGPRPAPVRRVLR